jgi:3-mercaptopyruvate sulfurtransferase SseA
MALRNEQQALYPADQFEQYIQRLGVDQDDLLVVYARGPMGGMLHASRAWFLFRVRQNYFFMSKIIFYV